MPAEFGGTVAHGTGNQRYFRLSDGVTVRSYLLFVIYNIPVARKKPHLVSVG